MNLVGNVPVEDATKRDPQSETKNVHLPLDERVDQKVDVIEVIVQDHARDHDHLTEIGIDLQVERIIVLIDLKERQALSQVVNVVDRQCVQKETAINEKVHPVITIPIVQRVAIL